MTRAARREDMPDKHHDALSSAMTVRTWLRLLSCSTIIEKRLRRRFIEEFDTTLPRFDVMAALHRRPEGLNMGELSRMLLVSNGNVTALVRQLQEQGLVRSAESATDRRSSIVSLTPQGDEQFETLARAHHRWIDDMFDDMPEGRLAALYDLLSEVKGAIAER